jgi:phosphopantothenoylcysteine decarboxylase / phosphopantothenate---cysteine ligase
MDNKNIVIGVTGGIAAYKTCELVRLFTKNGANVNVIMTANAQKFVTPLTFETLSKNRVIKGMFDDPHTFEIEHISLSDSCHLVIIAPASANIIAKFSAGICDDFLSTFLISSNSPKLFAPAMNTKMWEHPFTQRNLKIIKDSGAYLIEPGTGDLACSTCGKGRMAEPLEIYNKAIEILG